MLKDVLLDVVKHTNGLGFIEAVKIEGTTSETSISAMDVDRTVMLYGQLHNAVSEFEGTFGAANLGFLNYPVWDFLASNYVISHIPHLFFDILKIKDFISKKIYNIFEKICVFW